MYQYRWCNFTSLLSDYFQSFDNMPVKFIYIPIKMSAGFNQMIREPIHIFHFQSFRCESSQDGTAAGSSPNRPQKHCFMVISFSRYFMIQKWGIIPIPCTILTERCQIWQSVSSAITTSVFFTSSQKRVTICSAFRIPDGYVLHRNGLAINKFGSQSGSYINIFQNHIFNRHFGIPLKNNATGACAYQILHMNIPETRSCFIHRKRLYFSRNFSPALQHFNGRFSTIIKIESNRFRSEYPS